MSAREVEPTDKNGAERGLSPAMDWLGGAVVGVFVGGAWGWLSEQWSAMTARGLIVTALVGVTAALCAVFVWRGRQWPAIGTGVVGLLVAAGGVVVLDLDERDACGRGTAGQAVEVMVVWEGAELAAFCDVVGAYGPGVEVTAVGQDIGDALDRRLEREDPPDVAAIPQPSLVQRHATGGRLCPIADEVVDLFPAPWTDLVTAQEGGSGPARVYGAFVKGAHKSLFWYRPDALGDEEPETWSWGDLTAWIGEHAGDASIGAPLALPAGDRWPLTDWFENQLAAIAPDLYDSLAAGDEPDWDRPEVRGALTEALDQMAVLWGSPRVLAGGPDRAARARWQGLAHQLYDGQAALMFGPSFLAGPIDDLPGNYQLFPFGFPGAEPGRPPLVVGGDIAVVPRQSGRCDDPVAPDLVRWLTGEEAMAQWSQRDPGFLTPNDGSPHRVDAQPPPDNEDDVHVYLTHQLRHPPNGRLHFDLSDDQFAVANQGDPRGTWAIFYDYFRDVAGGQASVDCAVDRVIARLEAEYRGDPPPSAACEA